MKIFVIIISCFISNSVFSQIAIGNETFNPHTQLDITATQKGVLIPRVMLKDLKSPDPFDTGVDPLPESLLVYNTGGKLAIASGYYYWSNNQWNKLVIKDELEGVIPKAKDLSSEDLTIKPDGNGKGAVLKDIELSIKNKAVTPAKIKGGLPGQILTSGKDSTVEWKTPVPADIPGKNLSSGHLEITNDGKGAVLKEANLTIKNSVINTGMLQDKAVIPSKISSGDSNQILRTTAKKEVIWADFDKNDLKDMTSTHLEIKPEDNAKAAVLKKTKLTIKDNIIDGIMIKDQTITGSKIRPGGVNTMLTTNGSSEVVWADIGSVKIINQLESIEKDGNILKSTVNGASAQTAIVKEVKNTLKEATEDGYPLTTSVNGVSVAAVINIHEPWHVSESNIKATENTQNIEQRGGVGIGTKEVDYSLTVVGEVRFNKLPVTKEIRNDDLLSMADDDSGLLLGGVGASNIAIPRNGIIMWSGAEKTIPKGWAICDGKNRTPNLINRFVVGAGEKYKLYDTGGQDEVKLTGAQMPNHHHSYDSHSYDKTVSYDKGDYTAISQKEERAYTKATGGGKSHENRPPYYALYYIMRL